MGPVAVVVLAVSVGMGSGVSHAFENLHVQQFVSEAALEAIGVAVLLGAARFNVKCLQAQRGQSQLTRNPPVTKRGRCRASSYNRLRINSVSLVVR
jgi:hypothetical protein